MKQCVSGNSYNFEIYSSKENLISLKFPTEPDIDAAGNVVVLLCRIVQRDVNGKISFYNYYTLGINYYVSIKD